MTTLKLIKSIKYYFFLALYYGLAQYFPDSYCSIKLIGKFSNWLRIVCVRNIFKKCGNIRTINRKVNFNSGKNIEIGDHSGIGARAHIPSNTIIGNNVIISRDCCLWHANHKFDRTDIPLNEKGEALAKVTGEGMKEIPFDASECSKLCYSKEIMQKLEAIIFEYKIDTVFIHFNEDMNRDHIEANNICLTASRHCANIFEYQSNGYILDNAFYPTFFINISNYVDKKREALSQYGSEHNRMNRLFETVIERNHIWGYANEVEYAEGFRVVKMIDEN